MNTGGNSKVEGGRNGGRPLVGEEEEEDALL